MMGEVSMMAFIYVRKVKRRRIQTIIEFNGHMSSDEMKVLLKKLQKKLGTGGYIEDNKIVLRGDHRDRLQELLYDYGISLTR